MRLIDADALKKDDEVTEWITRDAVRTGKMLKAFSELFVKKIDNAPTVFEIPDNATNGDVIKALFPKAEVFFENQEYGVVTIKQQCEDAEENVRDDYVDFSEDFWCTTYGKEFK